MQKTAINTTDKTTILIVDDRQENILTLENIIESESRNLLSALSGNEALKILMNEPVDLLLIDVQMPEMDGYEVANLMRLNPKTRHIPIVFVSAISKDDKKQLNKFDPATVDFLFKPLDLEDTRRKVLWIEKLIRQEKELKKCRSELEKIKEDFGRFTYLVTHDVKAPLRAIDNLVNWITEDMGNNIPSSVAENLSLLQNRVNRTQNMLNALSDFSRIARFSESRQPVSVKPLIHSVIESIPVPASFRIQVSGCDFTFAAEQILLTRIFTELIKNCVVHHEGGSGTISIGCEENPDHYIFSVQDDGPGIPRHLEEKAFEIFQTLKSKDDSENTGIGLPIVKRIIENLGHKIWIDRSQPAGLTIKFTWHR